jgi:hypothetical protein
VEDIFLAQLVYSYLYRKLFSYNLFTRKFIIQLLSIILGKKRKENENENENENEHSASDPSLAVPVPRGAATRWM